MGNRFNNHNLHHRSTSNGNGIFLPMLCSKSSIKDTGHVISSWPRHHPEDLPSSPKVSCIGQVKNNLRNNNKIAGFPVPPYKLTDTSSLAKTASTNGKYHKLKRLFSGRNLATPTPASSAPNTNRVTRVKNGHAHNYYYTPSDVPLDITALDPPLPVVKKAEQAPEGENLWKRRSCGAGLRTLQLEKINVPCKNKIMQPTTV